MRLIAIAGQMLSESGDEPLDRAVCRIYRADVYRAVCRIYRADVYLGHTHSPREAEALCKLDESLQWEPTPSFQKRVRHRQIHDRYKQTKKCERTRREDTRG